MKEHNFERNREEIATAVYEQLLKMVEFISFGSVGVTFTLHKGIICKTEFTETKNTMAGGESWNG